MAVPVALAAVSVRGASTWVLLLTRARGIHAGSKVGLCRDHGTVVSIPPGSGSNGVSAVDVVLQRGGERLKLRVHSTAITVPGSRSRCTAWCGAAPTASNMDTVCMGHLVAYVPGLYRGRGARPRVGRELACSRVSLLLAEMDKCCDRGGVPSCGRVGGRGGS